ncbi:hypothetical protein [Pseudarthrobacter sp. S9]|uniref:hypothetical protein n=1 Tax=Pseudarthrobacter sp. S9 TaxID=3418421 RepID=UPI003D0367DF
MANGLLALALLVRNRPQTKIFAAAAGVAGLVLTEVSTAAFLRDHPANTLVLTAETGSFPSSHVAVTTASSGGAVAVAVVPEHMQSASMVKL